jgi:hypothetical protein
MCVVLRRVREFITVKVNVRTYFGVFGVISLNGPFIRARSKVIFVLAMIKLTIDWPFAVFNFQPIQASDHFLIENKFVFYSGLA